MIRRFALMREVDETGISGTGKVAEGVVFSDGTVALRWLTEHRSTAFYNDLETLVAIHGHNGSTRVEFSDTVLSDLSAGLRSP